MSIQFLAVGYAILFVLFSVRMPKRNLISITLIFISLSILASVLYFLTPHQFLNNEVWYNVSPWKEIILFSLMILGMFARTLSKAIEERRLRLKKNTADSGDSSLKLDVWEISYPLLFSIPTYGALLSQIGDNSINVASIVLAFETGFMWQTLLKSN